MLLSTTALPAPGSVDEQTRMIQEKHIECNKSIENEYYLAKEASGSASCNPIWDGLLCWGRANAGQLVTQHCPTYVVGSNTQEYASKLCTDEGLWYSHPINGIWTNFSQCFGSDATVIVNVTRTNVDYIKPYLPALKIIIEVGYSLSLISLLVAFAILISFKRLRCPRNVLHMHLFASFIMRASLVLLKDSLFVWGLATEQNILINKEGEYLHMQIQHNWPCKMLITLRQYCIKANYSWILMEGLYLHNLIFQALFVDSSSITLYIILGWGLPAIFVLPWTVCRALLEDTYCWTTNDKKTISLLIEVPIMTFVMINFGLFVNIVRVLLSKLQTSINPDTQTYRRWAKSTLVLIPLFGAHYTVLLGLRLSTSNIVEVVWIFCDQIFASFNGFFVALLYCFLNGEVRRELAWKWSHFSFEEITERWHFPRNIFSNDQFVSDGRHYRPRGSCHSNTSGTLNSVVHSCNTDKKRQHTTTLKGTSQEALGNKEETKALNASCREDHADIKDNSDTTELQNCSKVKDKLSNPGKDRRWSTSDCDLENNAMELKSMTSSNNIVKL